MKLNRIDIVSIPVQDQDAAKAFYEKMLGFEVLREVAMGPGSQWLQMGLPGAETSITLVTWFEKMRPGGVQGLVLNTSDIDEAQWTLKERGLKITDVEVAGWGKHARFNDIGGNGWVLVQVP